MTAREPLELITVTVSKYLESPELAETATISFESTVPELEQVRAKTILKSKSLSYRDGLLIQLAYGLSAGERDLTIRHESARSVAQKLGAFFAEAHIPGVKDAYQNIAKNTPNLTRGNFQEFDDFLRWASKEDRRETELEAAFEFACAQVAALARPVLPMPELNLEKLRFAAVARLFEELFQVGSGGAYEQFIVAALLHGLVNQVDSGYRVETKSLNASDKSSRAAGDVQILAGTRVIDAFEVTANDWSGKAKAAGKVIRDHDLSRIHLVARSAEGQREQMLLELMGQQEDVSVIDLRAFTDTLLSGLTRKDRGLALARLYEFLDRYQPDVGRVNAYVEALERHGLTVS